MYDNVKKGLEMYGFEIAYSENRNCVKTCSFLHYICLICIQSSFLSLSPYSSTLWTSKMKKHSRTCIMLLALFKKFLEQLIKVKGN